MKIAVVSVDEIQRVTNWIIEMRAVYEASPGDDDRLLDYLQTALARLITAEQNRRANTNLCYDCQLTCMAECPENDNIVFGCGVGNDNVVECKNYISKEAYAKYQNRRAVSGDVQMAIQDFQNALDIDFVVNGLVNVFSTYQFKVTDIALAITALQAYATSEAYLVERYGVLKGE